MWGCFVYRELAVQLDYAALHLAHGPLALWKRLSKRPLMCRHNAALDVCLVFVGVFCLSRVGSAARLRCAPSRSRAFGPMEKTQQKAAYVQAQRGLLLSLFRTAFRFREHYTIQFSKKSRKREGDFPVFFENGLV